MYGYDHGLFRDISRYAAARFDYSSRTFYIKNTKSAQEDVERILGKRLYAKVDETNNSLCVRNFFLRDTARSMSGGSRPTCGEDEAETVYFSADWAQKLELELRSRKYSPRTIQSYLHHNAAFCRFIRESPQNAEELDIQKYLAHLEKKDKSASIVL
jgi:hypothetical protein